MKFVLTEKRMIELLAAEAELSALNMGGVDNWTWYGDSIQMFFDEVKRQTGEEYDDFESYARGIVEKERKKAKESLQKCDSFIHSPCSSACPHWLRSRRAASALKKTMTHLVLQLLQCYSSKTDSTQVKNKLYIYIY